MLTTKQNFVGMVAIIFETVPCDASVSSPEYLQQLNVVINFYKTQVTPIHFMMTSLCSGGMGGIDIMTFPCTNEFQTLFLHREQKYHGALSSCPYPISLLSFFLVLLSIAREKKERRMQSKKSSFRH